MAKKTVNIEVGDSLTKISVCVKNSKTVKILKSFHFQTPEGAVIDGQIINHEAMAKSLISEMVKSDVSDNKNVIFILSSTKIVSREVTLPPIKENKLKAIIAANAEEYFPIDLSGYKISHALLEKVVGDNPSTRVMITAVPNTLLFSYQKLIKIAGLNLESFDYIANSQYQLFKHIHTQETIMYVGIGIRQTLSTFMKGNQLLLQRSVPFGGVEIINTAMMDAHMSDSQFSETLDLCSDKEWVEENVSKENIDEDISRLVNAISRTLDFFKSAYKGAQVDKIVVFDTCCDIYGLKEALSSLGARVTTFEELPDIKKVVIGDEASLYAAEVGSLFGPLDLIPEEMSEGRHKTLNSKSDSMLTPILVVVLCLVSGVAVAFPNFMDYQDAQSELTRIENRIDELSYLQEEYNTYVEYTQIEKNLRILEDDSINNNAGLKAFLEELEEKMPSNLRALSASCDDLGVSMNIEVRTMEEAAVVMEELRTFETIEDFILTTLNEDVSDDGVSIVSFSLSCNYYQAEEETIQQESETDTEIPDVVL